MQRVPYWDRAPLVTCGTLATTRAMALVACTDIKTELVKNAPVKVPIM